ncbi:MAG: hypothetical protein DMG98_28325 [Acidobacteria bacterium]|nr:MAG: hypothetical protein DMG98_28325 [Acidobacteriota bacterium]
MAELPFSINRVEDLIRAILWLTKREWGLAFLLACPSLLILAAMSTFVQDDALFEGPVFRAGFYIGRIVYPNQTAGSYALFGLAANFLVLMGFWFVGIRVLRRLLANKRGAHAHGS